VLDVGAGTGKLTRLLVSAFDDVIAVEPDEEMRRILSTLCPEARVLSGRAEQLALADASVDAVFAAESFHAYDGERALAEFARVLRPRGELVLMWNLPVRPADPAITAVEEFLIERAPEGLAYDPVDLNTRRYATREVFRPFAASSFEELQEVVLENPQTIDRDGLVAFFASMGWLAELPAAEQARVLHEVRSLLPADEYQRVWETHVHWTRLPED
jgi:ubiquinone/menaquinone biosynthesis C-methylase UbiE